MTDPLTIALVFAGGVCVGALGAIAWALGRLRTLRRMMETADPRGRVIPQSDLLISLPPLKPHWRR